MRAASPALQAWWPDGGNPRSWQGVTWSDDRVQELNLFDSKLEVLPPHPTMRLVTYQRWERRRDVQRQMVLRTMAQARHSE